MINDWEAHILHIMHEKLDCMFHLKVNMISRLPKPVELSHEWVLKILKYQEPSFYARLFDDPE